MPLAVLALETSSERCSVALRREAHVIQRESDGRRAHSDLILPFVRELLAEAGMRLADLDAVAFGAGPGGFTGLRLACGIAQGLAFGAGLPVVAVGSLEALAWASAMERVYTCVDARMNEVYCGAFLRTEYDVEAMLPIAVAPPDAAPLPPGEGWIGCGSGFAAYGEALRKRFTGAIARIDAASVPGAHAVAALAAHRLLRGGGVEAVHAEPLYVREKVAYTTAERIARGGRA